MKKIILILSIFLLVFTFVNYVEAVTVSATQINVNLLNQNPDPVQPGKYVELRWKIENNGGTPTKNFVFKLKPKFPFSLDPGIDLEQKLGKVDSYQVGDDAYVVYYKLLVDQSAGASSYSIDYEYSYDDGKTWFDKSDSIQVEERDFIVTITNVNTEPEKVSPGQEVNMIFTLNNIASTEINDVRVKLTLEKVDTTAAGVVRTELPFSPVSSTNEQLVESLGPGKSKTFVFPLSVDASAETKVHKIPLTITYKNNDGTSFSKELTLGIPVYDEPKYLLNLESTEIYKNDMKGKIIVSLSNIGITQMKFLTIKLLPSENYDIISSKTLYVGNLDSDDFETAEFEIYSKSKLSNLPLKLSLSYTDEYNNNYEKINSEISVPLYSEENAIKYGFEEKQNNFFKIINILFLILLTIFWIAMVIDVLNSKHKGVKKLLWVLTVILTYFLGAIVYYFIGRKKQIN